MTGFSWAVLGVLGGLGMTAIGDIVSEEVRDRLDHLPHTILRLAAWRLDPTQRTAIYDDEWLPELTYILKGDEARPITRLYHGTRFALGILFTARRIASRLDRTTVAGQIEIVNTLSVPISVSIPIHVFHDADRLYMSGVRGLTVGELIVLGQSAYKVTGVLNDQMYLIDERPFPWEADGT